MGQAESGIRVGWELCVGPRCPGAWDLLAQGSHQSGSEKVASNAETENGPAPEQA